MNTGSSHPGLRLKNRKILIVADDRAKVLNLTDILASEGYKVEAVKSGAAAIDCTPRYEPDLILLDAELPGENVFELCRMFKPGYEGAGPPVIFIASDSDPSAALDGLAAGGVDYLSKPFRRQEILARIRVHLLNRLRLAQLSRKDKAKNRVLSMAAHDLRNPLVSIRALTNLLRTGAVGSVTLEQRDVLDTVYDASQSMLDLINDLLEVSVLETGEMKLNPTPTLLAELVAASVKLNNATAEKKGSRILWQSGKLPSELSLDKPKIRQVLNNLLDNAIKFSPSGSTITVATELAPGHCSIMVRDQGPGIPMNERTRLFQDFGRTSVKPTGDEPSTGLGLSICHRIMLAHQGSIRAESLPTGGAEFRITLPLPS